MKTKIIIKLLLVVVVSIFLYSCVHDEISSSSDLASKEYQSKSIWKEDETYIKNVMQVYKEHETEIQKINGTPLWDYAMTMGYMNESFLIVPVSVGNKIVSCIQVPRNGDMIRFVYDNDPEHIKFFQGYTTLKNRKPLSQTKPQASLTGKPMMCAVSTISWWYPDSEDNTDPSSGAGHWETQYITTCSEYPGGGGNPGCSGYYDAQGNCVSAGHTYPYPGGGGGNPQQNQDPCAKLKAQRSDVNFYAKMNVLESDTGLKKEIGYIQRTNEQYTYKDNATATDEKNTLGLPNPELPENKDIKGYMHTHVDDYTYFETNGDEMKKMGIKMFSPADMVYFMDMIKNAKDAGSPLIDVYAVMVSSLANYQIRFTGNQYQIKTFTNAQSNLFRTSYTDFMTKNEKMSLELKFLKFINDTMGLRGVSLFRMNADGTSTEVNLNADKTDTTESNCPN